MPKRSVDNNFWAVEVTNCEGWTANDAQFQPFPGGEIIIDLPRATEIECLVAWFEFLNPLSRALKPGLAIGDWRYEDPRESPVNMGQNADFMPRRLAARVILPAGEHTIRFEARRDCGPGSWTLWGFMKGTTEMPLIMKVKALKRY